MRLRPPRLTLRQRLLLGYLGIFALAGSGFALLGFYLGWRGRVATSTVAVWMLAALALFAVGLWLALYMANSISAPLQRITRATRMLANGRFDVRVGSSNLIEANSLASGFNEMAESLASYNATNIDRLIAEQHRNAAVLSSIDDGLVILDEHARIERINPVACRQLGIDADVALGHGIDDVLKMTTLDQPILDAMRSANNAVRKVPDLIITVAGVRRILAVTLSPFHDLVRRGVVMLLQDVTAERQVERLRSDFIMRASHELRTPVSTLSLSLSLLRERAEYNHDSREANLLAAACDETRRLVDLVNDLLDISRMERDSALLQPVPCAITEVFKQTRNRFATALAQKSQTIDIECKGDLPRLSLDPSQFSRLLDNLVSNALRHTANGGRILLAATTNRDGIEVVVSDNGEGIASSVLARIFEPFVQAGSHVGGAGLGLTLCREIVERHDGRISVESEPERGAAFTIQLPWSRVAG